MALVGGYFALCFGGGMLRIVLAALLAAFALTGYVTGMVGISGGSFKVPLMVLLCGVTMRVAVGTSSAMVAATALMGFIGHAAGGDVGGSWLVPVLAAVAAGGGLLGGTASLKTKPERLKPLFAATTLAAAGEGV
jgi:uncharacterized membrane protein YfcA